MIKKTLTLLLAGALLLSLTNSKKIEEKKDFYKFIIVHQKSPSFNSFVDAANINGEYVELETNQNLYSKEKSETIRVYKKSGEIVEYNDFNSDSIIDGITIHWKPKYWNSFPSISYNRITREKVEYVESEKKPGLERIDSPINPNEWNSFANEIQSHLTHYKKIMKNAKKKGKLINKETPEWEIKQDYYKEEVKVNSRAIQSNILLYLLEQEKYSHAG